MDVSRVRHLTYATPEFSQAIQALLVTARRWGLDDTTVYSPENPLVIDLARRFPEVMGERRGAGYWLWKPFIIRDALARASPGDAVLYTDVGLTFVSDPWPLLDLCREHPVVLFEHVPVHLQREWTKRDCFVALDADNPADWETPQLLGGMQLYHAGAEATAFIDAVCAAVAVPGVLIDAPNVRGLPSLPGFREHRQDQSVLTIVARRFGLPHFPDPSQFGPRAPQPAGWGPQDDVERPAAPYGQIFHVHRKRDTGVVNWYWRRLVRRYTGGHGFA